MDDDLHANLAAFAALDYPRYGVILGVKDLADAAYPVARAAARRWPDRMRVVIQRGAPGLNPKVNQLITLEAAARYDIVVISDSNVRVDPSYLDEIAAHLENQEVALVTHPIVGAGERRWGSLMDGLYLASSISPGIIAAQRMAGQDLVVGKSMAMRRSDVRGMGGFEAVKDVLAEDFVIGRWISDVLGKRVRIASRPIWNVTRDRSVGDFWRRFRRWSVMQRQAVGTPVYFSQAMLNPVMLAAAAALVAPTPATVGGFAVCAGIKSLLDAATLRALAPEALTWRHLAVSPAKDLVVGASWLVGLFERTIEWRGNRLRVTRGTRLERLPSRPPAAISDASVSR